MGLSIGVVPATASTHPGQTAFKGTFNGDHLCLQAGAPAGTGSAAPQADVWECGLNNSTLQWVDAVDPNSPGHNWFMLINNKSKGCLDDWGGSLGNGSPVKLYGNSATYPYGCSFADPHQVWVVTTLPQGLFLMPKTAGTTFHYGTSPVMSVFGPGVDGSAVHLWRSGANDNLQAIVLFGPEV